MSEVTPAILRELLRYEPETGKLFWLPRSEQFFADNARWTAADMCRSWNARYADTQAFITLEEYGCYCGKVFGRTYKAHRVAWAITHGVWPTGEIDHINRNPADNRLCNLRDVTPLENKQNKGLYKANISGVSGVIWYKPYSKWLAAFRHKGVRYHVGYFDNVSDAASALAAAKTSIGIRRAA